MEVRSGLDGREPEPRRPSQCLRRGSWIQHTYLANTLRTNQIRTVLSLLFVAAAQDDETARLRKEHVSWETATAQEHADASESAYMSISAQGGDLLYILARAKRPNIIVEFGASYGISTIYLAAAVADNRKGHVVSTELNTVKVAAARASLTESLPRRSRHHSARRRHDNIERSPWAYRSRAARRMEGLVPATSSVARVSACERCVDHRGRH
jgi:hypothetical protein